MLFTAPRPTHWLPTMAFLATLLFAAATAAAEPAAVQPAPANSDPNTSIAIAENVQGAFLLRRLLKGRQFTFFGRVEGEFALYDISVFPDGNDLELRRFRLGLAGLNPWFESISYKVEFDYSDSSGNISDAYLAIDLGQRGSLTIGNQDGSQSLSASTGSLSQLFMESPLPISAFGLDKRIGVAYDHFAERAGVHLLLFGQDFNNPDAEHSGLTLRAYFNPYRSAGGVWHLGASGVRENIDDSVRLRTRPESHVTDIRLVDTGVHEDVERSTRLGIEAAGALGSFTTRLELLANEWQHRDGSSNRFTGAYLEGGYFLTGEPFRYRNGKFVRPTLDHGQGAWELAYRYSWVDLEDGDVQGGEERNLGLALNYYPAPRARGQLNLIQVNSTQVGGDGLLFQARIQLNW
jgi:phosphate-selective porin OprO/OprP